MCAIIAFINLYGYRQCKNDHSKKMRDFIYDKSVDALKDMLHTGAKNLVGG